MYEVLFTVDNTADLAAAIEFADKINNKQKPPSTPTTPTQGTYTQAHPKTYTPERVLNRSVSMGLVSNIMRDLKEFGFEITPISVRERAERRAEFGKPLNEY